MHTNPLGLSLHLTIILTGGLRDKEANRPCDIALSRGHNELSEILAPPLLLSLGEPDLHAIEGHFHKVILDEAGQTWDSNKMRLPDLGLLRDYQKVWMPVPGMYGVRVASLPAASRKGLAVD